MFLADAREIGACKRAICERHGLIEIFPTDEEEDCHPSTMLPGRGLAISGAMERVMRSCDAMPVNITPVCEPSADVGSAYEMGFMRARSAGRSSPTPMMTGRPSTVSWNSAAAACTSDLPVCMKTAKAWSSSPSLYATILCSKVASLHPVAASSLRPQCR